MGDDKNTIRYYVNSFIILLVIVIIFAFNDKTYIGYPIKVVFIIIMGFQLLLKPSNFSKFTLWCVTFIAFSLASVIWAYDQNNSLFYFTWMLQAFLIAMLIEAFIDSQKKLEFVLKSIMIGGLLLAVRVLLTIPPSMWGVIRVGPELGYNQNDLGMKLAFAALCSVYFLVTRKSKKSFYLLAFIVMCFSSMLTGSRKAFFIFGLGTALFVIFKARNKKQLLRYIPLAATLVVVFYYAVMNIKFLYNVLGDRIEGLINLFSSYGIADRSSQVRQSLISDGVSLFLEKPIFGHGIGSFGKVSGVGTYSHNNYIELLVGSGILGFCLYYIMYFYLIFVSFKLLKQGNSLSALLFVIVLFTPIIETGLVTFLSEYNLILLALSFAFIRISKNKSFITLK